MTTRQNQETVKNELKSIYNPFIILIIIWILTYSKFFIKFLAKILYDNKFTRIIAEKIIWLYHKNFEIRTIIIFSSIILLTPIIQFSFWYISYFKLKPKSQINRILKTIKIYSIIYILNTITFFLINYYRIDNIKSLIYNQIFILTTTYIIIRLYFSIDYIFVKKRNIEVNNLLTKKDKFAFYEYNLSTVRDENKYTIQWEVQNGKFLQIINSRRGTILIGVAGSGKSYSIVEPYLSQIIAQGQCLFNYDVKFPDLTLYIYNEYLNAKKNNPSDNRDFKIIYPNDIRYSSQSNPFDINITNTQTKSREAVMTILYNLNRSWIDKQGDFFQDSAITFAVAASWFLHVYEKKTGIKCCTLAHLLEFITYENFDILIYNVMEEIECQSIMSGIATGYRQGATDQLAGQVASLQIALSKIIDKNIYYVSCKNTTNLDVNNPDYPLLLNLGGAIETQQSYAPLLSLYASTIKNVINKKNKRFMAYVADEIATMFINNLAELPNTGRSNGISVLLALQNLPQLTEGYKEIIGEVLKASFGNIICGQITDDKSAQMIGNMLGEYKIKNASKSIDEDGKVNITKSEEWKKLFDLDELRNLQLGEFVGATSDIPIEENKNGNTQEKRSQFAVKIKVTPPKRTVKKLPYFNKELILLFKDIKNIPKNWYKEYKIIYKYFESKQQLEKENNQENRNQLIEIIEKNTEKINNYINYYKTDSEKRFLEMYKNIYNYKNEFNKLEQIKNQNKKIQTNTKSYLDDFEDRKNKYINSKLAKTKKMWDALNSKDKSIKYIPYLFGFIMDNYQEKEEQIIMNNILDNNFIKIKKETENILLNTYFHSIILKKIKNIFLDLETLKNDIEYVRDYPDFFVEKSFQNMLNDNLIKEIEEIASRYSIIEKPENLQKNLYKSNKLNEFLKTINIREIEPLIESLKDHYTLIKEKEVNLNFKNINKEMNVVVKDEMKLPIIFAISEKIKNFFFDNIS